MTPNTQSLPGKIFQARTPDKEHRSRGYKGVGVSGRLVREIASGHDFVPGTSLGRREGEGREKKRREGKGTERKGREEKRCSFPPGTLAQRTPAPLSVS